MKDQEADLEADLPPPSDMELTSSTTHMDTDMDLFLEEVEKVIEKIISNGADEGILGKVIKEHGRGKVLENVVEIQDRHDAAKEFKKSLLELHQVFMDMVVMVEAQGEKMDDIEHHVLHASHYVKDKIKNLQTAKKYQRSSRKWMCIGIILFLILILVIVILIATSFRSS
ncbi:Target SNARE coiled-coil-like proteiny domain [Sesbania bispinosa]|nr:Target SNARE coiled-coil-like proteiny domain [Sesbania bispinosa]